MSLHDNADLVLQRVFEELTSQHEMEGIDGEQTSAPATQSFGSFGLCVYNPSQRLVSRGMNSSRVLSELVREWLLCAHILDEHGAFRHDLDSYSSTCAPQVGCQIRIPSYGTSNTASGRQQHEIPTQTAQTLIIHNMCNIGKSGLRKLRPSGAPPSILRGLEDFPKQTYLFPGSQDGRARSGRPAPLPAVDSAPAAL